MSTLKHLNLTERDFELIISGLDALPEKGMAGEMLGDFIQAALTQGDEEKMAKIIIERKTNHKNKQKDKDLLIEDIKILQGKLLMLKRYLMEQGALNETQEILNHIS